MAYTAELTLIKQQVDELWRKVEITWPRVQQARKEYDSYLSKQESRIVTTFLQSLGLSEDQLKDEDFEELQFLIVEQVFYGNSALKEWNL